jgi:hypothetical protein
VRRFQSLNLLILTLVPSAQICNKELVSIENTSNKKQKLFLRYGLAKKLCKAVGKGIDEDFKNIPLFRWSALLDSNIVQKTSWHCLALN